MSKPLERQKAIEPLQNLPSLPILLKMEIVRIWSGLSVARPRPVQGDRRASETSRPKPKPWRTKDRFEFTNMDPVMLLLVRKWLINYCRVHPSDFTYAVCIHRGADVAAAQRFWSRRLRVPRESLRTYFKRPNPYTRRHNSGVGFYGTIRMSVRRSVVLLHRIIGWIRAVAEYWGVG